MFWRGRLASILVLMLVLLLGGCSKSPAKKPASSPPAIGFSVATMETDVNKIIRKYVTQRARKDRIRVVWLDARMNPEEQRKQVEKLIKNKVKTAVIHFVNPGQAGEIVRLLQEKGIKIVALHSLPDNVPLDGFVAADAYRAGQLQAEFITQQYKKGAQKGDIILLLRGNPEDYITLQMTAGFKEVIEDFPQLQVVTRDYKDWDPTLARQDLEQYLSQQGSKVGAVVGQTSQLALAAVDVLEKLGMADKVVTLGAGADKPAIQAIAEGKHDGEIDPMPEMLASVVYQASLDLTSKQHWDYDFQGTNGVYDVPSKIIPVRMITENNVYLVEQRAGPLEKREKTGSSASQSGSGSQEKGKGSGGTKTKLKIKTREGKTLEIEIEGKVEKLEIEESKPQEKSQQGGDKQGQ
ncbi:sugar ABC transporter substrate-binding protein [Calderihabitans maritimus]|uniref:ABC-type sugar transport system, periplasmic component n=1 Tax=Calderihabitans maritimus TaxID=1246530 RepID=A0A1Z5HPL0_9FIRM|nr:substrate-binding domain-containing protein [Calderihabitans maritimus]GAW91235.1 ABC-type sugar transport system, periplasmic component [Calderihabitans maritimus]